ncbi:SH3 beta-barrel fold-containing protein [Bacteroidales bacterium OttesenSCG-928-A17]|nr:SH3 beta-barrel fold-containing protein [Bacteroidales bacterium OttesenSCG-928-A17]
MKTKDLSSIMTTAHRFIKIAGISLSEALKRAWANFKLARAMKVGIVKFYFKKVDGSIREAYGTLMEKYLPEVAGSDRKKNDTTQVYFDTEKQEYRCFKKMNLVY